MGANCDFVRMWECLIFHNTCMPHDIEEKHEQRIQISSTRTPSPPNTKPSPDDPSRTFGTSRDRNVTTDRAVYVSKWGYLAKFE